MLPSQNLKIGSKELGRRLATTRRSRNLSQAEVAKHLEVSRPTLVAIEKGTRPAKPEELIALSQLFGRSVHELVTQREFIGDFTPQFRLTQAPGIPAESVEQAVSVFQQLCEDYLALETLLAAPMPRAPLSEPYSTEGLTPQAAAEEAATLERSRLNLGLGPLPHLLDVLETDAGLRVFVAPLEEFRIAGMFVYTDRLGGCILVNGQHPLTRRNWSLAHEYSHFLTDRYRDEITLFYEYERKPRTEQFADSFAASFLMPAAGIRQQFRRIAQSKGDFTVADLCLLADRYNVSMEAITRRLESLGSLRKGTWEQLSSQGLQPHELRKHLGMESGKASALHLPDRYVRLAVQAHEEGKISESELTKFLRCSRVEAREIVEALTQPIEVDLKGKPYQLQLDLGDLVELNPAEKA
jgi:Zn-dependent peptidase ImmA (M78 family)/transcriptional regulator with XRE-family HTH domain